MPTDADETISEAAQAGLPVNLRRRVGKPGASSAPDAKGDPASSGAQKTGPGSDPDTGEHPPDPGPPSGTDEPEIETLTWVDGRLVLVKEPADKGRTHESGPD